MLDDAKGDLKGEEAFQAEMDALDRLEQELDALDDLREQIKKCLNCNEILETEVIPAKYPIWYLYFGIGIIAAIIIAVAAVPILFRFWVDRKYG